MLNTKKLCEAVTHQPQAERRIIGTALKTMQQAQKLSDLPVCKGKSASKILSHGVAAALSDVFLVMASGNGDLGRIPEASASAKLLEHTNVGITLSPPEWQDVGVLAEQLGLSTSAVIRALAYLAMEQAYYELSGR